MNLLNITKIIEPIIDKYNYRYNFIAESDCININFIKTKYSSLRPDGYFEMIEEIIYNSEIMKNYKTILINDGISFTMK
jgi:hypothetical protein